MRKTILKHFFALGLLIMVLLVSAAPVVAASLTPLEEEHLIFIREEEKLARDFYIKMYEKWGSLAFHNIEASEQEHMDAVLRLLVKYGIPDPASNKIGAFNNTALQQLYNNLMRQGEESLLGALQAGAFIEEYDIKDLRTAYDEATKADLRRVYGNLEPGSENHLRAFVSHIEALTGKPYVAQFLTQDEVDEILGR
jgi:hypothetical protein